MGKKSKRILIVEDEKPVARALQLKLTHSGFESDIAVNGQAALKKLAADNYDLVLLDLVMSNIDGFVVLEDLKARRFGVPIIVISNLGQEEDIRRAKSFGIKEYFVKSDTSLQSVVESIKEFLKL